ncbi:AI-2E family transporter [Palleronia sp. LCG004]|uniref:AI-2E family transporter n=1 Tax=Palleronia sp. LCG004 TaxID=3079304 RepID=UPI0029431D1F|nr:AI-2E family transporter [Palleronia sp. LCG004]WOI57763.1 AI-2E family transporter [Palleronia sp. LCG004]
MQDSSGESDASDDSKIRHLRSMPRWAGIAIFIYATVFTLSYAKSFFVPVVLAFLLTLVFSPIRRVFDRRGIPSALTSLIIVLSLLITSIGILGTLSLPVTDWISRAPEITAQVRDQIGEISGAMGGLFEAANRLNTLGAPGDDVQRVVMAEGGYATDIAALVPGIAAQVVFTLVLLFFLLASGNMFYEKLVHVIPRFSDKRRAMTAIRDIERELSRYLFTITVINAGLGIAVGTAMWAVGMPSPIILGMIAFLFNFVPYLGALAGIVVASAVALVSFDWVGWAPVVGGIYLMLTTIEGQIVTPYFVGRNLRLNTVVVFLAVSFWAWLWSAVGMVVAVPLLAALRTISAHIDGMGGLADFLGERHSETETDEESDTSET